MHGFENNKFVIVTGGINDDYSEKFNSEKYPNVVGIIKKPYDFKEIKLFLTANFRKAA